MINMQNKLWIYSAFAERIEDFRWISHIDSWFKLIQCWFMWQTANSCFKEQIYLNSRKTYWIQSDFIMNWPSDSRIYNKFDILFAYFWFILFSDWINFPIESIFPVNSLRKHYLLRDFTIFLLSDFT